jgi:hypothetical protein
MQRVASSDTNYQTDKLLTGDEAAALIGVDPETLAASRNCARIGIRLPFVRLDANVLYREVDVLAFKARRDRLLRRS